MRKAMPIGVEDFCELRKGYYFVDKTRFIRQLLDERSKVTLLTRPRRFGKTLTMSMLDWFSPSIKQTIAASSLQDWISSGQARRT